MNIGDTLKGIKKKLTTATASVMDDIAGLRKAIAAKQKELDVSATAPLPLEEIEQNIRRTVDEHAAEWLQQYGSSLITGEGSLAAYGHHGSIVLPGRHGDQLATWGALCAGDPQRATAMLRTMVGKIRFEPGVATAARPALLKRLQQELREMEQAEESLIDSALEAGLRLDHRPEVTQRRNEEARRRELEEAAVENRRAREEALNQEYAARARRPGESQYLKENAKL